MRTRTSTRGRKLAGFGRPLRVTALSPSSAASTTSSTTPSCGAAQAGFSGSITVENHVIIGGQVGVGEHARIQEGVLLGGQAGVLPKKILRGKGIAFWGTPAKPLREYLRSLASLARLGKRE